MQDCGHPYYAENYQVFYEAIKAARPNITVIANCDLGAQGYTEMFDWHMYTSPL